MIVEKSFRSKNLGGYNGIIKQKIDKSTFQNVKNDKYDSI